MKKQEERHMYKAVMNMAEEEKGGEKQRKKAALEKLPVLLNVLKGAMNTVVLKPLKAALKLVKKD